MGWKLPPDWKMSNYSLYTFSRLTALFCFSEFRRQVSRFIWDIHHSKGAELKSRVYADYLFLVLVFTGVGLALGIVLAMFIHTLTHDWNACGGRRWIPCCWKTKLCGATKPLGKR
jgi:uncharacterized BrkB/YihY/UPF0761 family membrane protein